MPPGTDAKEAQAKLTAQLESVALRHARVGVQAEVSGEPFAAATDGPVIRGHVGSARAGFRSAHYQCRAGRLDPPVQLFGDTYPAAEIMLIGVEELRCLIHAPNESVSPGEIQRIALAEALFLSEYAPA